MKEKQKNLVTGAVALVFAVLGYQTAMLVHYAAVERITANRDHPDTVFVYAAPEDAGSGWSEGSRRREGGGGGYSGSGSGAGGGRVFFYNIYCIRMVSSVLDMNHCGPVDEHCRLESYDKKGETDGTCTESA